MKTLLRLAALATALSSAPVHATTVYDFFINYRRQDSDLQIAFAAEAYRNARLKNGKMADCINKNFVKSGPRRLPAYEDFKTRLYSTNVPDSTEVEESILDAISQTCNDAALAAATDIPREQVTVHSDRAFRAEYVDDRAMAGAAIIAVNTQFTRAIAEGEDVFARCVSDNLVVTGPTAPAGIRALLAALKDDTSPAPAGVEGLILGAIIYYCKEEPVKAAEKEPAAPAPSGKPLTDLDRANEKAYEDFQARIKSSDKVLDQMEEENKKKQAEAMNELTVMQKMAARVPDGRRVYQSKDGKWTFEDESTVPPALVPKIVPPPKTGWLSIDMRVPPVFDEKAAKAVFDRGPKAVIDSMMTDDLPVSSDRWNMIAVRLQAYYWEQLH